MRFWGWILRGLIVMLGIGLFLLQSQSVKKSILELLLNQSFKDSSLKIDVGFVRGLFPFQFTVASLRLNDKENHTLAILSDIHAVWAVPSLINGKIRFNLKRGNDLYGDLEYFIGQHGLYTNLNGTGVSLGNGAFLKSVIVDLPTLNLLKGHVSAVVTDRGKPVFLTMELEETSLTCLKIHNIRLTGHDLKGAGKGTFYSKKNIWEGQADVTVSDLAPYSYWTGKEVGGTGHIHLEKTMEDTTLFNANLKDMRYGLLIAKSFAAQGKIHGNTGTRPAKGEGNAAQEFPDIDLNIQSQEVFLNGLAFSKISGKAIFNQGTGKFSITGGEDKNISFKSQGEITFSGKQGLTRITLAQAELCHPLHKIVLKQPSIFLWNDENLEMPKLLLKTGNGSISAENIKIAGDLTGNVKIEHLPLTLLRIINPDWIVSGSLSGKGTLRGSRDKPEARLLLDGKSIHWQGTAIRHKALPGINISAKLSLLESIAAWQVKLSCKKRLNLSFDGKIITHKLLPAIQDSAEATLKGEGDLDVVSLFIDTEDLIRGQVFLKLNAYGTLANPQLEGALSIKNGIYENASLGTFIKNIKLDGNVINNTLNLSISGQDATKGTLSGNGTISFPSLVSPVIDFQVKFDQLMMIQNDEITARTAGNIGLKGTVGEELGRRIKISGDVTLQPLEVRLDHHPSKVVTIKLLEKKKNGAYETLAEHEKQETKKLGLSCFDLDINISSRKNIYLRGYGLDSQWKGDARILGTQAQPCVEGKITLVKGKFDLLGKQLKLTEGLISFSNDTKNDPLLNIVGAREIGDVTAMMRVEGHASSPQITFSSNPALPQEEVLARLIFDKGLESISVTQTLLLANALTSFKSNNDLNFTDKIRSAFGLDVLEFKERKSSESEDYQSGSQMVSVGKRVSDKFYLSLDQSVSGDGGPVATVEYGVTRNLKIEAGVGGEQNSSLGFSWIKRY